MVVLSTISQGIFVTGVDDNVVDYKNRLGGILTTTGNEFASFIDEKIDTARSGFRMLYNPWPLMSIYILAQTIHDNINDPDNKVGLSRWDAQFGTLDTTGATTINNNLTVTGTSTLSGATTVSGAATIHGTTTLNDTLTVSGATTVNNNLTITGTSTLSGATTVSGAATIHGATTINNNLIVTGTSTLSGATTVSGALSVAGATTLTGAVTGHGTSTLQTLNVTGNTNMTGNLNTTGKLTVSGASTINNNLDVTGTVDVTGSVTLNSNLTVSGNTDITGTLTVIGNTVLGANSYVGSSANTGNRIVTQRELNTNQEGLHVKPSSYVMIGYELASFQSSATSTVSRTHTVDNVTTSYSVSTYTLNLSGIIIDTENQGLTIDGVTITTSQEGKIILINQPSGATFRNENGMYEILSVDEVSETLELVRIQEADGQPGNDLSVGDYTFVSHGKKYQGGWACSQTPASPTSTTTDIITFAQFSGSGESEVQSTDGSVTISTTYDGSIKSYDLSASVESINITLDGGVGGISGNKSLPDIIRMIDNNFKALFQTVEVDGYTFENFFSTPAVSNNNPSSTSDTS